MKRIIPICFLLVTTSVISFTQKDFPKLTGTYLGQKPPGMIPEIFAAGLISLEESTEYGGHFSPDFSEFYFTRYSPGSDHLIWVSKKTNDFWSEPTIVEFMDKFPGAESCISPDGNYFFYDCVDTSKTSGHDIYKAERTGNDWNTPKKLTNVDLGNIRISPSVSSNGNLYFSGDFDSPGQRDIYYSEFINGRYSTPINLGEKVNSEYHESHVYVSPDESFILFDSNRPSKYGKSNIYISVKTKDDMWSEANNVGSPINSDYSDWYPSVTPDGKYLMFSRNIDRAPDIMWVEARVIEELKPEELR